MKRRTFLKTVAGGGVALGREAAPYRRGSADGAQVGYMPHPSTRTRSSG